MFVRFLKFRTARAPMGIALLGLALLGSGCANRRAAKTSAPEPMPAPRMVVAEPTPATDVYIEESIRYEAAPEQYPEAIGYETLSNGEQVVVVEYVHTYPEEIETFPQVAWAGRTYYNVHGDFVYWSPGWGWCYYLGPPAPLVTYWNGYYPWATYAWGVGYYGPGWYWGGVGMYGYHAYGLSVVHVNHHHHGYHQTNRRPGRDVRPSRHAGSAVPARGQSTGPVHKGEATGPARRKLPESAREGRANPKRSNPGRLATTTPARRNPSTTNKAKRTNGAGRLATGPQGSRANPNAPVRTNGYTTAGGRRITVVDPAGTSTSPARRNPTGKTTRPTTVGRVPSFSAPSRSNPARANPVAPRPAATRTNPASNRTVRNNPKPAARPTRTPSSWGSNYSNKPTRMPSRSKPTRSNPSRSQPTRSNPSRSRPSSAGSYRAPSRSAPSRSRAPSRSAPKRSAPSRSAPKRSAPSRSAPKRSGGKRGR